MYDLLFRQRFVLGFIQMLPKWMKRASDLDMQMQWVVELDYHLLRKCIGGMDVRKFLFIHLQ